MATTNMGLTTSSVGVTAGPTWATNEQTNLTTLDTHDHTSGKGVQLSPSALNINTDLPFNQNSATELKNVIFDSSVTAASTSYSLYQSSGNVYWRNGSGTAVQITDGSAVNTSGGSISGMSANAQVLFSSNAYVFKFDSTLSDPGIAKLGCADVTMYKYDASGSAANVTLKFLGTGTTGVLTVPDETGTLLSTSTSYAGAISIATSASDADISLTPNGTGSVVISKVDINGGTLGGFTIDGNWTAASQTCANLGTVTTADINGGTIDGTVIGASSQAAGDFTAIGAVAAGTITGTTIDATTDFTIGGMRLTDGQIADTGTLALAPVDGLTISLGSDAGDDFNVESGKFVVEGDTGNVGIGTTTWESDNKFQMNYSGNFGAGFYQTGTGAYAFSLRLDNERNDTNATLETISFGWKGTQVATIKCLSGTSSPDDGNLTFGTAPSAGGVIERMRINTSGCISTPTAGTNNVRLGADAGQSIASGTNYNVFIGDTCADAALSSAINSVGVGYGALGALTQGDGNTVLGFQSGSSITTGDENTILGNNCDSGAADTNNAIVIGSNISTASNTCIVGKSGSTWFLEFESSTTWAQSSDKRKKQDIKNDTLGLSFINDLKTKTFRWKPAEEHPEEWENFYYKDDENGVSQKVYSDIDTTTVMHGMIAQDVKEALDTAGVSTFGAWKEDGNGQQSLAIGDFVLPLIKAVQELSTKVTALEAN